jgi:ribosomal-protein-alanine acetyltransferase
MGHDAGGVIIRPGTAEDAEEIRRIQAASGTAAQWDPHDYFAYELWVAQTSRGMVGFVVARRVAEDEGEILNLAIHPDFRRRGIARSLLQRVLEQVAGSCFLEVRVSNRSAIDFYEAAGFRPVGVRRGYYSDPQEDAVVMRIGS